MFKIATLSINGLASWTKMAMLEDFLRREEIDILLLQEITHPNFDAFLSYKTYINVGTVGRVTALVSRDEIKITNVTRQPSVRGIAAEYRGMCLANIYAPSGAVQRQERECFCNSELTYLLRASPSSMIVGLDFNCVTNKTTALANSTIVER